MCTSGGLQNDFSWNTGKPFYLEVFKSISEKTLAQQSHNLYILLV